MPIKQLTLSDSWAYDSATRRPAMLEEILELWRYRDLLGLLVINHIKTRYRRSALGVIWTLLNPLLTMTVMTIAFENLFQADVKNYPVYILAGLLFWNFFSQSINAAMNAMVWGSHLLKRVYVPRTIFAIAIIGHSLINLGLGLIPVVIIMVVVGQPFTPALLFLPIAITLTVMFVLGLALFFSTLAVFFTDVVDMFQVALTAWFYLTPIMYPAKILPAYYLQVLYLNPAHDLLSLFRDPIYFGRLPEPGVIGAATLFAFISLTVGWWFFTRKADEFAYRL